MTRDISCNELWRPHRLDANHGEFSAQDVEKVVEPYRHEGRLTIYSGTHGDPEGNFSGIDYAVRDFAIEDRGTSNSNPRIRVVNVGRVTINIPDTIANATTDIMFACASATLQLLTNPRTSEPPVQAVGVARPALRRRGQDRQCLLRARSRRARA